MVAPSATRSEVSESLTSSLTGFRICIFSDLCKGIERLLLEKHKMFQLVANGLLLSFGNENSLIIAITG